MSESAATLRPAGQHSAVRLGSFALGARVIDPRQRLGATALTTITGSPETPYAGTHGFGYFAQVGDGDAGYLEKVKALFDRITSLENPWLIPILETGIAGRIAYVAEARLPGERLSDRLMREPRLPASLVVKIVDNVGSALQSAHLQRVAHGLISPVTIWIDDSNQARLGGFGLSGRGPYRDQELLAAFTFELLSGRAWDQSSAGDATGGTLIDRVRGQSEGLTERVATVIARGLERDPAQRFPSVQAFAAAFRESVTLSSQEIAAGAWEAISREDLPMAGILTKLLANYDPSSSELALLTLRVNGQPFQDPLTAAPTRQQWVPAVEAAGATPAMDTPVQSATGKIFSEAELRELFSGPQTETTPTRGGNPWLIFLTVVFALIAITTILVAITFSRT